MDLSQQNNYFAESVLLKTLKQWYIPPPYQWLQSTDRDFC